MSDFILDADPLIPSGTPADPPRVVALIADGILPPDRVPLLAAGQQPDEAEVIAATDAYLLKELSWSPTKPGSKPCTATVA